MSPRAQAPKPTKPEQITVYASVPFKDANGEHEFGSEMTLPYATAQQQTEVDTMIRYGVVSKTKPKT